MSVRITTQWNRTRSRAVVRVEGWLDADGTAELEGVVAGLNGRVREPAQQVLRDHGRDRGATSGAEGMIYNEGGRFFGYGLYLLRGKPVFTYNFQGLKRTKCEGPVLAPGKHTIEFDFEYDGLGAATLAYNNVSGVGRGGTGTLKVDGKAVAIQKLDYSVPLTKPLDTVVNIGAAAGTPVHDKDYQIPFRFTGKLDKLRITLEPPKLTPEDIKKLKEAEARQAADK